MLCVECGQEVDGLIGGSCASCFAAKNALLSGPEVVDLELCAHCGARRAGSHWHDVPPDVPEAWTREDVARESMLVHLEVQNVVLELEETPQDLKHFAFTAVMNGHVQGVPVTGTHQLTLRRRNGVCDRCSRIAGGYYAAIIQLRATDRDVSRDELERAHKLTAQDLSRQLDSGNRFSFIAKEGEMHGGWDYYVGDIDAARNVSRILKSRLSATVQETAKLVGRREGDDVYRVTFLVRIRLFAPGDCFVKDDVPYVALAVHPTSIGALRLDTLIKGRVDPSGAKRLGGPEILEEATLVSQQGQDAQIVDPKTFHTVTVRVPQDFAADDGTLWVLRHEEQLYWAPTPNKS